MRRDPTRIALAVVLAFGLAACEGPEGPAGPAGPQGPQGDQGEVGPAGQDANENCTQCHTDDTELTSRQLQYMSSVHFTGGNSELANYSTSCAACHSHEGFVDRLAAGTEAPAEMPLNPSPPNCRTCHQIHTTYTDADFAFTTTAAVDLWTGGTADLGGAGNLCAQCHQARTRDPMPELGGADVVLDNEHWGPHHGPQGNVVAGEVPFEFDGSATIDGGPSAHGAEGCSVCHMAEPYGTQAGGHTWNMTYSRFGTTYDNIAGCVDCHSTITDFGYANVQTTVETLLDDLLVELTRIGIWDAVNETLVLGTWSGDVGAAFWVWEFFHEDRSLGIHNPAYAIDVLTNALEAMEAVP